MIKTTVQISKKTYMSKRWIDFLIFSLIFMSSSFTILNNVLSATITKILWLVFTLVLIYFSKRVEKVVFITMMLLSFVIIVSDLINGEPMVGSFSNVLCICVATLFVSAISFEQFKLGYSRVIKILCVISLIGFIIYPIIPILSEIGIDETGYFNNFFIYVHVRFSNLNPYWRNFGLFWEPGAFQTFIGIGLIFELFNKKVNYKNIVILLITTITTFSTTGYIATIFIMFLPFLFKRKDKRLIRFNILLLITVIMVIVLNYNYFFDAGKYSVFGKLSAYSNGTVKEGTSFAVRYYAITKGIMAFFENPILGKGYMGLKQYTFSYTDGMNTCTFVNFFAVYGIIYGTLILNGFIKFAKKLSSNKIQIVLCMLVLFLITLSENYITNASILVLAFYGISKNK